MTKPEVTKVTLTRFRGWGGENQEVPLDADFVLVSAANGRGKSSLLEALGRALGGTRVHEDEAIQTLHATDGWRVEVTSNGEPLTMDEGCPVRPLTGDVPGPATIRRATWFTQDPLDDQFERSGEGDDTLLGYLAPFPKWLEDYQVALDRAINELRQEKPRGPGDVAVQRAERRREEIVEQLLTPLASLLGQELPDDTTNPLTRLHALAAALPGGPAGDAPFDARWARDLLAAIEGRLRENPRVQAAVAEAMRRRDEAQTALDALERQWPEEPTRSLSSWFLGPVDMQWLARSLTGLAKRPDAWGDADAFERALQGLPKGSRGQVPRLDELRGEVLPAFAELDQARAERVRVLLDTWNEHWAGIEARRAELQATAEQATTEIRRLTAEESHHEAARLARRLLDRQQDLARAKADAAEAERRRQEWPEREARIAAMLTHLELCATLREQRLVKDVTDTVKSTMNEVMKHFVVAGAETGGDGVIALEREEQTLTPDFADGRGLWKHMSTGQKAQDALAWLLGSNALLQHWLPHRLLLLDDLSTALDLTNLAAECALLRKFAYGSGSTNRKRQVILASHHDQLTHRIYDLLLPPEGFTMLEVQLTDWSMQEGPTVESFRIKATRQANETTRSELGKALGRGMSGGRP